MIFSQPKELKPYQLFSQIKAVETNLAFLARSISLIEQAQLIFRQVQLTSRQICDNLMVHSRSIAQISILLQKRNNRINIKTTTQLLDFLSSWLENYFKDELNLSLKQKIIKVMEIQSKLACLQHFMIPALTFQDDIVSFPFGSQLRYSNVYSMIDIIEPLSAEQTSQQYQTVKKLIVVTNAAVLTELTQSNSVLSLLAFGISYPRFMLDIKTAKLLNYAFLRKPNLERLVSIWNLPQNGAISGLKYCNFPCINTNQLIYIPQNDKNIQNVNLFELSENSNSIPVRILSNRPVIFWENQKNCCCSPSSVQFIEKVIIHAHGGGFVALSSSTMQNYTRLWSKQLDAVVLSIDYKKPPLHTFPAPVYDFYHVYSFVCKHIQKFCNINPKAVIVTGDSAGGNLALSATALAMKAQLPLPQGVFLAYPACDLRSCYTPSRIHAFNDAILHPSLLLLCLRQYLGDNQKAVQNDPLASPILLSQSFLGKNQKDQRWPLKWPKTRIIVGQIDPLLDDSVRLCAKMVESGINVRCNVFRSLGHGFLSVQKIIKEGQRGIEKSISLLKQMFQNP